MKWESNSLEFSSKDVLFSSKGIEIYIKSLLQCPCQNIVMRSSKYYFVDLEVFMGTLILIASLESS